MTGLHDADSTNFPNLALMKLSAAYKQMGLETELWRPDVVYDSVVSSKVFTFTPDTAPTGAQLGGYGRGITTNLPDSVEHICPDYSLYGLDYSLGFLTRGCCYDCPHCFVQQKEGGLRAHADFTEFVRHNSAVFMDNNVLASDHGIEQIEKLAGTGIKVDFNQGLDARFIDDAIAKRLGKLKWLSPLRLACDSKASLPAIFKAVTALRKHNVTPSRYFAYLLVTDVDDAAERVDFLKALYVDPFAQPFIDRDGTPPTQRQKWFARWVNMKAEFKSQTWNEYLNRQLEREATNA